jgi:hypothetical protein
MKTRNLLPFLAVVLSINSAHAQEASLQNPLVTCYKLTQQENLCAVPGPAIINYQYPRIDVVDLNGAWADASNVTPYIYFYADSQYASGYTIRVDLSLVNRPDGFGYMVDANTIAIVFPDDRDYTGKIENNGRTIRWSNNTVWTKR